MHFINISEVRIFKYISCHSLTNEANAKADAYMKFKYILCYSLTDLV